MVSERVGTYMMKCSGEQKRLAEIKNDFCG